jgi:tetratricopeptide (TPR) repeat protein/tRNA A-37 threonylcarbamoyl transferase component Bud32
MIGTTVSHYRILEKVGEGGMGAVYLAQDTKLERRVALKFLPEELTRDDARKERFMREARAAAAIQHPHIAAVHDVDEAEGRTFIAMEYVRGQGLRELIGSEKLGLRRSLELGAQIAEGLAKAHEAGVVHRDVKPENVIVSEDGYAKIIDFGLAKLLEREIPTEDETDLAEAETQIKTREGLVVGTMAYMSPEQALGEPLDARSDVFSLGAVLYEMLSGGKRLRSKKATSSLGALLKESPPPLSLPGTEAPEELEGILSKAVAREPSERYSSLRDLARDLRGLRDRLGSVSRPLGVAESRPLKSRWLWGGVALGAAALVAVVAYFGWGGGASPPGIGASGRPAIAVMRFDNMTGDEETEWLSEGLPRMLTTDLAQTPGLDVVSRPRLHELAGQVGEDDREGLDRSRVVKIAELAGAGAVVIGSIFKAGEEIRIDAQLEEVTSGKILSSQSVRGEDVFALAEELTRRIREGLEIDGRPGGEPLTQVTTALPEAYRLYSEGVEALRYQHYPQARSLLEEAIELDPEFAMAHYQLSRIVGPNATRRHLDKALDVPHRLPMRERLLVKARDARLRGEVQEAVGLYEKLMFDYPGEADAYLDLSQLYKGTAPDEAIAILERGIQTLPTAPRLRNALGYRYLARGRYPEAIRELETYASFHPNEPNPLDSLGDAYMTAGQPEEAVARFRQALEVDPSWTGAYTGLSWAYAMLGRYDDALEANAVLGKKDGGPYYHAQEAILLFKTGRYTEAQDHMQVIRELAEKANVEDKRPLVRLEILASGMALQEEDHPRALEHAERALRLAPDILREPARQHFGVLSHLFAGVAQARSGNLDAAREHLEAQEDLDPSDEMERWWHGALAGEIALAEGDPAASEEAFVRAEPNFKMNARRWQFEANYFRDGRARVNKAQGDLDGAIEIYRDLNTPDIANKWTAAFEPRYVLQVARLLDQMGRTEEARQEYERFLEYWKDADEGLPELEEARAYVSGQEARSAA